MSRIFIPEFANKSDLFAFLRTNKDLHIMQKKSAIKEADGVFSVFESEQVVKDIALKSVDKGMIHVTGKGDMPPTFPLSTIINTTNLLDSHKDVHIVNLWKKSLQEKKLRYLLKRHDMSFESIIADSVNDSLTAEAAITTWKDLGFSYKGETQALVYKANVDSTRNTYMADQYWKGYVLNHSVGMQYVKMFLCMNSDSKYDITERDNFEKYKEQVVNLTPEDLFFWAVTEAKEIEGSAVPLGSNQATPTLSVGQTKEPGESTPKADDEPPQGTPPVERKGYDYFKFN